VKHDVFSFQLNQVVDKKLFKTSGAVAPLDRSSKVAPPFTEDGRKKEKDGCQPMQADNRLRCFVIHP
jgi:hypothetical protein